MRRGGGTDLGLTLMVEPGRAVVADAGVLLTRVLYVKEQAGKRFIVVDAAMTELIRPALYQAYHAIMPVTEQPGATLSPADVVGPVCESGDFFARGRLLPPLRRGDLLAIRGAGAYSSSMASNYNSRPYAAEVMVSEEDFSIVRDRQSLDELLRNERDDGGGSLREWIHSQAPTT
jgi:diaminopimelate decarboxylase